MPKILQLYVLLVFLKFWDREGLIESLGAEIMNKLSFLLLEWPLFYWFYCYNHSYFVQSHWRRDQKMHPWWLAKIKLWHLLCTFTFIIVWFVLIMTLIHLRLISNQIVDWKLFKPIEWVKRNGTPFSPAHFAWQFTNAILAWIDLACVVGIIGEGEQGEWEKVRGDSPLSFSCPPPPPSPPWLCRPCSLEYIKIVKLKTTLDPINMFTLWQTKIAANWVCL